MQRTTSIIIPTLVRIKPKALDRLGVYATRSQFRKVVVLMSDGLNTALANQLSNALHSENIVILDEKFVVDAHFEYAQQIFKSLPNEAHAIIGFGGGKALDVAKYVAFLARRPYIAVPTSLSNDGFCSPQSSLDIEGKKRSLPAAMPYGVVIDTEVCFNAPVMLWLSGMGDLVSKITAVYDWKLAFKAQGTQIDDFAALLSDATVFQLMARPEYDLESIRLLGTALMLNGIAMEICGSSRPASGSEHLISHALDLISQKPRLHGLQVGMATYLISQLQDRGTERIAHLFDQIGFWEAIKKDPFVKREWLDAVQMAPTIKQDFYTVLSQKNWLPVISHILNTDPRLQGLFV